MNNLLTIPLCGILSVTRHIVERVYIFPHGMMTYSLHFK